MKFAHILVVIFVALLQGANCHKSHRVKISSQMHLNAIEYIMACERTQRYELRKEKLEKSGIRMAKKDKEENCDETSQKSTQMALLRSIFVVKTILQ